MTNYALFREPVERLKEVVGPLQDQRVKSPLATNTVDNFRQAWDVCIASSEPVKPQFSINFVEAVARFADFIGDVVHSGGAIRHAAGLALKGQKASKEKEINDSMACLFSGAIIDDSSYQAGVGLRDFIATLLDQSRDLYKELNHISKDIKKISGHEIDFPAVLTRLNQELTKSITFYESKKPNQFYTSGSFHRILEDKKAEYETTKNEYITAIERLKAEFERKKHDFSSLSPSEQRVSFEQEKAARKRIIHEMESQLASFHSFLSLRHADDYLDYDWLTTTLEQMRYLVVSSGHHETLMRFIAINPTISLSACDVFSLHVTPAELESLTSDIFGVFSEGFIRVSDRLYYTTKQRNGTFKPQKVMSIDLTEYDKYIPSSSDKSPLSGSQIDFIASTNKVIFPGYAHVLKFAKLFGTSREQLQSQLHEFYVQSEAQRKATFFDRHLEKQIERYKSEVLDFTPTGSEREEYSAAIARWNDVKEQIGAMSTALCALSARVVSLNEETSSLLPLKLTLLSVLDKLEGYNQVVIERKANKGAKHIDVSRLLGSDELIVILNCSEDNSALIHLIYEDSKVPKASDIFKRKLGTSRISLETIEKITTLISFKIESIKIELNSIDDKEENLRRLVQEKSTLESVITSKQADAEACKNDVEDKVRSLFSVTREIYLKHKYSKKMGLFALSVKNKRLETIARDLEQSSAMLRVCNSTPTCTIKAQIAVLAANERFYKIGIDEDGTPIAEDIANIKLAKKKLELYVIHQDHFGQRDGIFLSHNRPTTNQGCIAAILGSLFESLAALFWSCFNYQSETAFLATLEAAGEACQKDCVSPERQDALNKLIDDRVRDYPFDGTHNRNQLSRKLGDYQAKLNALYQPRLALSSFEVDCPL